MSLSDLASIGSFLSGVAVVVSFAFPALQMAGQRRRRVTPQARVSLP